MTETTPRMRVHRKWLVVGATIAALAVVGWGVLHPEFRPDPGTVTSAMLDEFFKTGFKQTRGISVARFEDSQSMDGVTEVATAEQRVIPRSELLTEKRTTRRAVGLSEEIIGLYVGPFAVVRFHRTKPPIIGDLLPYHLWTSSRMTKFVVEQADQFPRSKGGKLRAKVTYEDRYADGHLVQTEDRLLQCEVTKVVPAAMVLSGLSGPAARVECNEELEADGRKVGAFNPQTWSLGRITYAHWYVIENHWSIPSEGEMAVRVLGSDTMRRWTTKVTSFEPDGQ